MLRSRRIIVLSAILLISLSFECRKASGVDADPLDREASDALVQYLRIDTTNPPGNETAGARYLQQLFAKEGIEAKLIGSNPARQSVVARLKSGTNEKALVLLHHIDVVPAAPTEWTKPPFGGLRENGYIWGRGALDIKSLGIAEAMAMIELKRKGVALKRDVIFLATPDEELGGLHGCKEILEQHPEAIENAGFVLNEGGDNQTIVDRVDFWGVEVQSKVAAFLQVTMRGAAGHGAAPPDDGGTMLRLVRTLDAISRIPTPYRLTPAIEKSFHAIGATKPDEKGEVLRAIREPLDVARLERVLSPAYRALLHDTIAITRVNGGSCVNCIPSVATANVDIRVLPDESPEPLIEQVKALLPKGAELEVLFAGAPVPESASDTELFRVVAAEMKKSEPKSVVAPVVGAGTSDSRWFRARGVTAYGIAPFKVNYYDAGTVHAGDERIREKFFVEGTRLVRRIVTSFCARAE